MSPAFRTGGWSHGHRMWRASDAPRIGCRANTGCTKCRNNCCQCDRCDASAPRVARCPAFRTGIGCRGPEVPGECRRLNPGECGQVNPSLRIPPCESLPANPSLRVPVERTAGQANPEPGKTPLCSSRWGRTTALRNALHRRAHERMLAPAPSSVGRSGDFGVSHPLRRLRSGYLHRRE